MKRIDVGLHRQNKLFFSRHRMLETYLLKFQNDCISIK